MRIAIANRDVLLIDQLKREIIKSVEDDIIWISPSKEETLRLYQKMRPELLFLDVNVFIDKHFISSLLSIGFCAIVVTSNGEKSNGTALFDAMDQGATDVLEFPDHLSQKLKSIKKLINRDKKPIKRKPIITNMKPSLVILGASTGGPIAIAKVLEKIPATLPISIVIIQHVEKQFSNGLVEWLSKQCCLPIQLAETGDSILPGRVHVAQPEKHLALSQRLQFVYVEEPDTSSYYPSIDQFCLSVAKHWPYDCIAALLTGMGSDGAEGLKALKERGHFTIAEKESSCVIYGMPKAAIEIGAATEVVPIDRIGEKIVEQVKLKYG